MQPPATGTPAAASSLPREMPDRLVRRSLEVPANLHDFLRDAVPHLSEGFDYARVKPVNREMFTGDWRIREADLLFEIPFLNAPMSVPAIVAVLLEHQSDTDRPIPLRMLFATTGYWERCLHTWEGLPRPRPRFELPPVLPILLYTGDRPWGSARTTHDLLAAPEAFRSFAPDWGPIFWELANRTPQQLLDGGGFMQVMALLRVAREEQAEFEQVFAEAMRRLQALRGTEEVRWHDLLDFALQYAVSRRPRAERPRLVEIAAENHPGQEREVRVMAQTIAESYIEEGRLEGELKRSRQCLQRVLEYRFGSLPESVTLQITTATDPDRLTAAIDQAMQVKTLEEFKLW